MTTHTKYSPVYLLLFSKSLLQLFAAAFEIEWLEILFDNVELGIDLVAVVQPLPLYRCVIYAMPTSSHTALKSAKYIEDSDEELEMAKESPSSSDLDQFPCPKIPLIRLWWGQLETIKGDTKYSTLTKVGFSITLTLLDIWTYLAERYTNE